MASIRFELNYCGGVEIDLNFPRVGNLFGIDGWLRFVFRSAFQLIDGPFIKYLPTGWTCPVSIRGGSLDQEMTTCDRNILLFVTHQSL